MDDTHPEARRMQIELLRKAGPDRRAQIASQLTNQSRWRTRRNIARAYPHLTQLEQSLRLLEVYYGADLAQRVRTYLSARSR